MSCFDNLIGISNLCGEKSSPTSGLWLDSLPGISVKMADATIGESYLSGKQLLEEKRTHAVNYVINRLRSALLGKVKLRSNLENDTIGFWRQNLVNKSADAGYYRGLRLTIYDYAYIDLTIESITLQLTSSGAKTIKIFDLTTGTQVGDDIHIATIANTPVKVSINKSYTTDRQMLDYIFVYDGAEAYIENNLHKNYLRTCVHCTDKYTSRMTEWSGVKIDSSGQLIDNNIIGINGGAGMSIKYGINCSFEKYVCSLGNILAWAILHKWGAEVIKELNLSTRLNTIVTIKKGDYNKILEEFELEFENSFKDVAENIRLPDDICFECGGRSNWNVRIP